LSYYLSKFLFLFLIAVNFLFSNDFPHPKSGTVIFVHGLLCSSTHMVDLAHAFKKDGWTIVNWSYPSTEKYIEEHASDLVNFLQHVAKQKPGRPISFVTHSMGGLIVRCALNRPYCPYEATLGRAVLIAPPNRGSILARKLQNYKLIRWLVGNKAGTQLLETPKDGFDQLGNFPYYMPVLVIAGTFGCNPLIPGLNDGQVTVEETFLKTPHFHEKVSSAHSWISFNSRVIKKTKYFLSIDQFY
jgi:pimeloyl-ACP methyl ester carboxylesterase